MKGSLQWSGGLMIVITSSACYWTLSCIHARYAQISNQWLFCFFCWYALRLKNRPIDKQINPDSFVNSLFDMNEIFHFKGNGTSECISENYATET